MPKKIVKTFIGAFYVCLLLPYFQNFKNAWLKRRFSTEFQPTAVVAQNSIRYWGMILTDSQHHIFDIKRPVFAH